MPIEWKKGTDGQPVIKDGKVVLFDAEALTEVIVSPADIYGGFLDRKKRISDLESEVKALKIDLSAFDTIKKTHADLLAKPQEVAAKLKKLADLEASSGGKTIDEQVAAVRAETAAAVEKMRADHAAELATREEQVAALEKKMTMDKFLLPWQSDKLLDGYRLPRDPAALEFLLLGGDWGKKFAFQPDGKVIGPDGLPMQDSSPGAVLKHLLENHPQRAAWKLSTMPEGVNIGGAGGGGSDDVEKCFKPDGFNLTKQLELQTSNPALYQQLSAKYA